MKRLILLTALLSLVVIVFGQDTTKPAYTKEYYLKKAKEQKTTGWVLLGIGTASITAGTLTGRGGDLDQETTGGLFKLVGGAAVVGGVISFLSAANNKRRASEVGISNEQMCWPAKKIIRCIQ